MYDQAKLLAGMALAGDAIMRYFKQPDLVVERKQDNSLVTQADLVAQDILLSVLKEMSSLPILTEESSLPAFTVRQQWSQYWLIDPLDGTQEFIQGYDHFTVNVALIENHHPRWGGIYVPVKEIFYYGELGKGAFRLSRGKAPQAIKTRQPPSLPLQVTASRSHQVVSLQTLLTSLPKHQTTLIGSSFKFCQLAEGKVDLYPRLSPTHEWDTAAGHGILKAAGGDLIDLEGYPLQYNTKASLLNPSFLAVGDLQYPWLDYLRN